MKYKLYISGENIDQYTQIKNEMKDNFNLNFSLIDSNNINEILNKKYFKIDKSDIILLILNNDNDVSNILLEMSRAYCRHKPIIIVNNSNLSNEIFKYHASILFFSLDTALDYINTFL